MKAATARSNGGRPKAMTHIKDLVPDPANRRQHNPRNIGMIVDALHQVGAARSIVIDEDNVILAGNGVTEAAAEAGITKLRVVDAAGDEVIAVRRSGLSADQKRALALYDNRTAELADWDLTRLQADLTANLDLSPFFSKEELADLLPGCPGLNVVDSIYGHDGFLVETDAVAPLIRQTLEIASR